MKTSARGLLALIAVSIATALLSACSSDAPTPVDVALGDVSINKVPFLIAADAGIYRTNGLEVHQFITPGAAEDARGSGVVVPPEYVRAEVEAAPIAVGGGSPVI
jgi:NitT/TauT family transport system substrate-binding protein